MFRQSLDDSSDEEDEDEEEEPCPPKLETCPFFMKVRSVFAKGPYLQHYTKEPTVQKDYEQEL